MCVRMYFICYKQLSYAIQLILRQLITMVCLVLVKINRMAH